MRGARLPPQGKRYTGQNLKLHYGAKKKNLKKNKIMRIVETNYK